ncbi:hypothetical protein DEU56DRAFT_729644 [Suillus clintonianus]|uniref:uncharacterized protein n=1 Tax=Suillus clintonianus TaxID=1904413 RepID=UPI001B872C0B|nr:uncharacterized protein DEU56DRAFT_729644 [Suillus clintonianus]KAG2149210.1 hypothetical protein DEU56DRAFT_729644 [Suillus clintonianus]
MDRAVWTDTETDQLVQYLFNNWAQVCDTGNFKDVSYNGAAEAIAPYLQNGPMKTGEMCKTKWGSLKQTYNAIQKYRQQSGVHWDNDLGANIQGEGAGAVWHEYISKKVSQVHRYIMLAVVSLFYHREICPCALFVCQDGDTTSKWTV